MIGGVIKANIILDSAPASSDLWTHSCLLWEACPRQGEVWKNIDTLVWRDRTASIQVAYRTCLPTLSLSVSREYICQAATVANGTALPRGLLIQVMQCSVLKSSWFVDLVLLVPPIYFVYFPLGQYDKPVLTYISCDNKMNIPML